MGLAESASSMGVGVCGCSGNLGNTMRHDQPAHKKLVQECWEAVHSEFMGTGADPKARVHQEAFVKWCMSQAPQDTEKREAFQQYANILFDTGAAMMGPSRRTDLGKHCFGYASLLASEFYGEKPLDCLGLAKSERPDDELFLLRAELDQDWERVRKDEIGLVTRAAFKDYFLEKYIEKLIPESRQYFMTFLDQDFSVCASMMLPERNSTIGGHQFRYGALLAGEFHFEAAIDAAMDATSGSRRFDGPARDALRIVE